MDILDIRSGGRKPKWKSLSAPFVAAPLSFSKSVASLVVVALLTGVPGPIHAQDTPQERAEKQRQAQERAEKQRQAQEHAEQQREAQERAEQRRETEERAERQHEAEERAERQRAEQRRQEPRPAATPAPSGTPPATQAPHQPNNTPAASPGATYRPGSTQSQAPPQTKPPPPATVYRPGASTTPGSGTANTPRPAGQATTPPGTPPATIYRPSASTTPASGTANTPRPPAQAITPGVTTYTPRPAGQAAASLGTPPATIYRPGSSTTPASGTANTLRPEGQATTPGGVTTYTPRQVTPGGTAPVSTTPPASSPSGAAIYSPRAASAQPSAQPAPATPGRSGASPGPATSPVNSPQVSRQTNRQAYTPPVAASIASRSPTGASVLSPAGSQSVVRQVNISRAGMKGVNSHPIPQGTVTMQPNGNLTVATASGNHYSLRANGTVAYITSQGRSVNFRPNGRVSAVRTPTVNIQRGLRGERVVRTVRPDRSVLVGTGANRGYLERSVVVNGRTIIRRTYVAPGARGRGGPALVTRVYITYPVNGVVLPLYMAPVYFSPAFYGWAFYPWATPVRYAWGWAGDPWFGYYSGYYQPLGAYVSAAAWLTDYYLSQRLANAYAMENQAPPLPGYDDDLPDDPGQPADELYAQSDTPITPALENAIADEVQRQLSYENAIASGTAQPSVEELPNSLKPGRIFVVSTPLDVATAEGQTCELGAGDVLRVSALPVGDAPAAMLQVASGKRQDCPAGVEVSISLQDLAEMQNDLRAQMDAGLNVLRNDQGQGGLPAAPPSAMAADPRPAMPDVSLSPDPNVADLLAAQQRNAQTTELSTVQTVAGTNQ